MATLWGERNAGFKLGEANFGLEMGCFQRHRRESGREGELFLFKRRRGGGEKRSNSHFLPPSAHL